MERLRSAGLAPPAGTPIWREARLGLDVVGLLRTEKFWFPEPARDGLPGVLLVPGLLAGDWSLLALSSWLRRGGYRTAPSGIRVNVDCAQRHLDRLATRAARLADETGARVALIGHSRGGSLARALAVRHPELVRGIVCLGAPLDGPPRVNPAVWGAIVAIACLGTAKAPGLFAAGCGSGPCCAEFRAASAGRFPADVGYVSMYSKQDGIVDWRGCLDPAAEQVEVRSSHCGMTHDLAVYERIARALRGFAATRPELELRAA